jgi:hypothetical protein
LDTENVAWLAGVDEDHENGFFLLVLGTNRAPFNMDFSSELVGRCDVVL